jgi:hypothetical protein
MPAVARIALGTGHYCCGGVIVNTLVTVHFANDSDAMRTVAVAGKPPFAGITIAIAAPKCMSL